MPQTSADHMIDIDKRLYELPSIPSERCICRVHDVLRNENKKPYDPEIVAIGPYHHDKHNLQPMEEYKLCCLRQLLYRRNETSAEKYIVAMQESEARARKFYAGPIYLCSNEFVEMMLLDSCFILEWLRRDEMMAEADYIEIAVRRDLVLFENQLPFFVVIQLFNMTKNSTDSLHDLVRMFARYVVGITPCRLIVAPPENPKEDNIFEHLLAENPREDVTFKHLLGLLHYCCCYPFHSMFSQKRDVEIKDKYLNSATELREAGIKFNKIEGRNLFDIRFVNGTMEIPTLQVENDTESVFRNLIAYEQYHPDASWKSFNAYLKFMDYLVNTSEDVEILTHHGIIRNLLGDNEVIATMLNKLGNNIIVSYVGYEEVYNNVNEHCRGKWNLRLAIQRFRGNWDLWLAILRRDYFNTPWALISFLAAAALLLLTLLQTIFSIISFQKSN